MSPYLKTTKGEKRKEEKRKKEQKSGLSSCHLSFSGPLLWGMCTTNAVLRGAAFKLGRKHCGLQNSFLVMVSQLKRNAVILDFVSFFFLPGQRAALLLRSPSLGHVVCLVLGCNYSPAWAWPTFPNEIMNTRVLSCKL